MATFIPDHHALIYPDYVNPTCKEYDLRKECRLS